MKKPNYELPTLNYRESVFKKNNIYFKLCFHLINTNSITLKISKIN